MKPTKRSTARLGFTRDARASTWGVHPRTLADIAAIMAGAEVDIPEPAERDEPQAAVRRGAAMVRGGVALIPLQGLITPRGSYLSMLFGGGGGLQAFRASLAEAINSDDITAIVLDVDSPGGSTDLVSETAAEIRAARAIKPIVAVANTWAASAAYWLAAQATEIVVTPSGEVGSIGVFTMHEDVSGMLEQLGVVPTLISAGKYKTEGNPYEPLGEEALAAAQEKVDSYYATFTADVAKGRGASPAAVRSGYGEGRMVNAEQAIKLGMADRVDTLEATIARVVRSPPKTGRRAAADPTPSGNPEPNPVLATGEEATARPSGSYIDLMFDPSR